MLWIPPWGLKDEVITTHVAQGQGLGGQGGFCSHCILWRMVWALLVSPGLSKVRVSEEHVWAAGLVDHCPKVCLEKYPSRPLQGGTGGRGQVQECCLKQPG